MASIVDQVPFNIHTGNGVTTTFGYTFQIFDDDDLAVSIDGVLKTSGFTVNGVGVQVGGDVTFTSPPASGAVVLLQRATKLRRDVDYSVNSDLPSDTLDFDVNRAWTAIQDAFARMNRAPLVPVGETIGAIPSAASRASKFLAFDASGNPTTSTGTGADAGLRGDLAGTSGAALVAYAGQALSAALLSSISRVVPNVSAIRSLSHAQYTQAFATGYYVAGDGGGGAYQYDSTDTTSTDNGGTIVVASDGARWKLVNAEFVSLKQFGCKCDGATDDAAAFLAAATWGTGRRLYVPVGTCVIGSSCNIPVGNNVSLEGDAAGGSIIKAASSLTFNNNNLVLWNSASYFSVKNITFDFNNRPVTVGSEALIGMLNCTNFIVEGCKFLHITSVGLGLNGTRMFWVQKNYFQKDAAAATYNQGLLVSSAAQQAQDGFIERNISDNTGFFVCFLRGAVARNTIRNWKFGGGITFQSDSNNSGLYSVFENICYGGSGTDVNATNCLGLEMWGFASRVIGNICHSNAGHGIFIGGQFAHVSANICYNNGQIGGDGINLGYTSAGVNASYAVITGNRCFDVQGIKTQNYGINEASASLTDIHYSANHLLTNKVAPENILSVRSSSVGPVLNASSAWTPGAITSGSSASLTFTANGVTAGDICVAGFSADLQGCSISSYANPGGNQVTAVIQNATGSSKTISAGTVYAKAFKRLNHASF